MADVSSGSKRGALEATNSGLGTDDASVVLQEQQEQFNKKPFDIHWLAPYCRNTLRRESLELGL